MASCSVTHLPESINDLLIVMEFIGNVPPRRKLSFHNFRYHDDGFVDGCFRTLYGEGHDDALERIKSIKQDAEIALRAYGNTQHGPRICSKIECLCVGLQNLVETYRVPEPLASAKLNKIRENLLDVVSEYKALTTIGRS